MAATPMVVKPPVSKTVPAPSPAPPPATSMKVTPSTTQISRNAAGLPTITNNPTATATKRPPTPTPSGDALRAHYDEMAKSFETQANGTYTVQFELVCETGSLTKAIRDGGSSVWFAPINYHSRPCYRVFWGHYAGKDEANRAAKEIPLSLRGVAPVVVKIRP